jgi:hypothetical protein
MITVGRVSIVLGSVGLVYQARELAQAVLARSPERWRHSIGVALRAERVINAITEDQDQDREIVAAAAWLHDIGYADALRVTGFHPIDGAHFLLDHRWPLRIAALVAHHSEASSVARARGLGDELADFEKERSTAADVLAYADQTVGPYGRVMTIDDRLADMLRRHGPESAQAIAHPHRAPLLRACVNRVEQQLAESHRTSTAVLHHR